MYFSSFNNYYYYSLKLLDKVDSLFLATKNMMRRGNHGVILLQWDPFVNIKCNYQSSLLNIYIKLKTSYIIIFIVEVDSENKIIIWHLGAKLDKVLQSFVKKLIWNICIMKRFHIMGIFIWQGKTSSRFL